MLTLTIDRNLETPVYAQVADQLRQLISSGAIREGTVLPPVRQLAGDLGVNLNTIARAYRLLDAERFLLIRDREGVRVAAPASKVEVGVRDRLVEELRVSLSRLRQAGMPRQEMRRVVEHEVRALGLLGKEKSDE